MKEKSRVGTNAQYIFDLCMDSPNHGYYFGTYEIGEYSLIKKGKLKIVQSYPVSYCTRGCAGLLKELYFGLREKTKLSESPSFFLVKLDWNKKVEPIIVWKEPITSAILAISLIKNRLFVGLKTGTLQIWDILKEECLNKISLFNSAVAAIHSGVNNIIITSLTGEICSLSENGNILWKADISKEKINGILEDKGIIKSLDVKGNFFYVNPLSGEIIKKFIWDLGKKWEGSTLSNLIVVRGWFIATGGAGIWARRSKNLNKSFRYYMEDPLIRTLASHPKGFYSGDDDGFIRFWKIGKIRH